MTNPKFVDYIPPVRGQAPPYWEAGMTTVEAHRVALENLYGLRRGYIHTKSRMRPSMAHSQSSFSN